eukprot:gene5390-10778_t
MSTATSFMLLRFPPSSLYLKVFSTAYAMHFRGGSVKEERLAVFPMTVRMLLLDLEVVEEEAEVVEEFVMHSKEENVKEEILADFLMKVEVVEECHMVEEEVDILLLVEVAVEFVTLFSVVNVIEVTAVGLLMMNLLQLVDLVEEEEDTLVEEDIPAHQDPQVEEVSVTHFSVANVIVVILAVLCIQLTEVMPLHMVQLLLMVHLAEVVEVFVMLTNVENALVVTPADSLMTLKVEEVEVDSAEVPAESVTHSNVVNVSVGILANSLMKSLIPVLDMLTEIHIRSKFRSYLTEVISIFYIR